MSLFQQVEKDYLVAYKAKNALAIGVLRLLKSAAKSLEIDVRREITDADMLDLIMKAVKQRRESIEQFSKAGRQDLADKEQSELTILEAYMPKALSEAEVQALINATIASLGASSPKEMGQVINAIMAEYKGQVDGKSLSGAVRQALLALEK